MCQRVMANPDDSGAPKEGGGGGDERFRVSCNWRRPFAEMRNDLNRRRPHYLSDWTDAYTRKVVSSALFMFFTSIAPGITFSALLGDQTRVDGRAQLGPVEVILSTAVTGSIFAIFGGQPLVIVGVTGPVTIFTIAVFNISDALGIDFLPFYCWVQIWAALMHMGLAASNACSLITLVTRYSCETFGMLIAVIYIYNGLRNLITYFVDLDPQPALLSLVVGLVHLEAEDPPHICLHMNLRLSPRSGIRVRLSPSQHLTRHVFHCVFRRKTPPTFAPLVLTRCSRRHGAHRSYSPALRLASSPQPITLHRAGACTCNGAPARVPGVETQGTAWPLPPTTLCGVWRRLALAPRTTIFVCVETPGPCPPRTTIFVCVETSA